MQVVPLVMGRLPSDPYDGKIGEPVTVTLDVNPWTPDAGYLIWCVFNVNQPCYYAIDPPNGSGNRMGAGLVSGVGWQSCVTLLDWEYQKSGSIDEVYLTTAPITGTAGAPVQFQNFRLAIERVSS
jgi:hypothetical protein